MRRPNSFLICAFIAVNAMVTAQSSTPAEKLKAVEALISSSTLDGIVGVYVVDAATSEVVVNFNGGRPMKPASCNKLMVTASGLSLLGADFRFATDVLADGRISGHTLKGDLVVKGRGDPSISGRFEKDKHNVTGILRRWADDLTSRGITRIMGNIVADDTFFDRDYFHKTWYPAERGEWYEAEVSGLGFNDNCVDLAWSSNDKLPGDQAAMTVNPPTNYARVKNNVKVSAKGRTSDRYYIRQDGSNDIVASGTLVVDSAKEDSASVANGPLYFVSTLRDVLTSAGIKIAGKPLQINPAQAKAIERRAKNLIHHESPPLSELVKVINLNSQNFYADCLCKTLGKLKRGTGSWPDGTAVVREFCRGSGVFCEGHKMVDGSGLSAEDRVSPRQLAEVVRLIDQSPLREAWRASFPIGGVRGTLRARFTATSETKALGARIMGKTGLIGGVRTMAGIIRDEAGHEMYYSIMVNDYKGRQDPVAFIDAIAMALAK